MTKLTVLKVLGSRPFRGAVMALGLASAVRAGTVLQVIAHSPTERTESRTAGLEITATFNQPMVALTENAAMGSLCPIRIEPPVPGRCRWRGTQVLAFEPEGLLPAATTYRVTIPRGAASQISGAALASDVTWTFETPRPQLLQSQPENGARWVELDRTILLQFNLPVDPKTAGRYVELVESGLDGAGPTETVPVMVRGLTASEYRGAGMYAWGYLSGGAVPKIRHRLRSAAVGATEEDTGRGGALMVTPQRPLRRDHAYVLHVKQGLPPRGGALGLLATRDIRFETWYTFVWKGGPVSGQCLPPAVGFSVAFSNPIRYGDLLDHLSVTPSVVWPDLDAYRQNTYSGNREPGARTVTFPLPDVDWKPDTTYSMTVAGSLKDLFGNVLGEDRSFLLEVGPRCPRFGMPTGFGILEGEQPPLHPVSVLNVDSLPVTMRSIPEDSFIAAVTGRRHDWDDGDQDPQESANGEEVTVDDGAAPNAAPTRPIPTGAVRRIVNLHAPRNEWSRSGLDLSAVLGKGRGGFAWVRAEWGRHALTAIDNVTGLGMTVKSGPDDTLVWVTHLKTGGPAPGIPVELRNDTNKTVWKGVSGADGLVTAPGWRDLGWPQWRRWERPALWTFAHDAHGPAAISTEWRGGLEPWRFGVSYDPSPRPSVYEGTVFTERGVYRPGETVYLKGFLRKLVRSDWEPADLAKLDLRVTDARGARLMKTSLTVTGESSFDASFPLSAEAPTGTYRINVTEPQPEDPRVARPVEVDEEGEDRSYLGREVDVRLNETFRVEAFKPASFEVHARPVREAFMAGDEFRAAVDGWYLFGAPMAGAPVDWKLRLEAAGFRPKGYEGFEFGPDWWEEESGGSRRYEGGLLVSATAVLDSLGKVTVTAKLPAEAIRMPLLAGLEAGVTSPERQRLFGRGSALVHPANVYVGIRMAKGFGETGKPWTGAVVAVRPDGRMAEGLLVTVTLKRVEWLSTKRAGFGGRLEWVSERKVTTVKTWTLTSTGEPAALQFTPDAAGQYVLAADGRDEQGRPSSSGASFYVVGKGGAWWERRDNDVVELVPDRKNYHVGDVAKLLVKSPFAAARALVTVERELVMDRWVTEIAGGAATISVPIKESYLPNVYVGVTLVTGRTGEAKFAENGEDLAKPQAKFGYATLPVDPGGRRLTVAVEPSGTAFRPGRPVSVTLKTVDEHGRGRPAEVTLFAVDEGVLALTGYETPDVFAAFYGPRPLRMSTADSRPYVIGQRNFGEKGKSRGGGGGAAASLLGVDLRTLFKATAYWNPAVRTDATGMASVTFTLPDNLTAWRLMAVASAGRLFGDGDAKVTASKPLLLRPSLPRLARLGDAFAGGVVVHNQTGASRTVTLGLELAGGAVTAEGDRTRTLTVGAGQAVEATWACRARTRGTAVFRFRASAGGETDGLEWKVPVGVPEKVETVATSGVADPEAVEALALPAGSAPGVGGVTLALASTAMVGLSESAKFLLEYPYGCLEQRLSRALPVVVGQDLIETYHLGSVGNLKGEMQRDVFSRLRDFQHPSGGFMYWPDGILPDPWLTAYALEVTAVAKREGYTADPEVVARAVRWLRQHLESREGWAYPYSQSEEYAARAYALYALALNGERVPGVFQNLFDRRDQLPFLAKANLLRAAPLINSLPAAPGTLADELLNQSRMAPRTMHFEEPAEVRMPWIHESTVATTALCLQSLLAARGGFPNDEKVVGWLVGERKDHGRWRSTPENAMALWALRDFYRTHEKVEPDFTARVRGSGSATPWSERFAGRSVEARTRTFAFGDLLAPDGSGRLSINREGSGRLYYSIAMSYAPARFAQPAFEGYEIEKKIAPLYGTDGKYHAGGRAVVTLTVRTRQDRTFVVLDDPLPAGFEIVDPTYRTESAEDERTRVTRPRTGDQPWWWGSFQRSEKYDDRILVFADFLATGEHTYTYLVQATTPGSYAAPSTWVLGMYEPEVFGRTASATVDIVK